MARLARAGRTAVPLLAIVLFAVTLRIAVATLSPVIDRIDADFAMPAALVGLIGMAPPAAFAVFAILAPPLEHRVGLERLALSAAIVATLGLAGRAVVNDAWSLLAMTVVVFAAVGVGNVLLPAIVKKYFPRRIGSMTAAYSTGMAFATFVPPLLAVPLADSLGWRVSFLVWAGVAAASIVPWIVLGVRAHASRLDDVEEPRGALVRRLVRLPLTWALVATFAVNASVAYSAFAWLPLILTDVAGATSEQAGALLALFAVMGLPISFIVPLLVARYRVIGVLFAVAVGAGLTAVGGLLFAPTAATGLWVALLGLPPLLFPMMLVLIGLRTRSHESAVALSGFVQSIGYGAAALVPLGIGVLHDLTGAWTASLLLLAGVIALAAPAAFLVARGRTVEDEWERRHGAW